MAERTGFEPAVPVKGHLVSSETLSTTQPPLQQKNHFTIYANCQALKSTMHTKYWIHQGH